MKTYFNLKEPVFNFIISRFMRFNIYWTLQLFFSEVPDRKSPRNYRKLHNLKLFPFTKDQSQAWYSISVHRINLFSRAYEVTENNGFRSLLISPGFLPMWFNSYWQFFKGPFENTWIFLICMLTNVNNFEKNCQVILNGGKWVKKLFLMKILQATRSKTLRNIFENHLFIYIYFSCHGFLIGHQDGWCTWSIWPPKY